ncbi:MAG: hypothetical protein GY853_14575 [PVC group bacterium]|nr:hypothetical protein [PVC group bacterium]
MKCAKFYGSLPTHPKYKNIDTLAFATEATTCKECGRTLYNEMYYQNMASFEGKEYARHDQCLDCRSMTDAYFNCYTIGKSWEMLKHNIENNSCNEDSLLSGNCADNLTLLAKQKIIHMLDTHRAFKARRDKAFMIQRDEYLLNEFGIVL